MRQLDDVASDLFSLQCPMITRGSPTLVAYQREDIRERSALQEEKVRATMAEVRYFDGLVDERMDAIEGTRARLHATRSTKQQMLSMLTAAEAAAADGTGEAAAIALLELELDEAEDREAVLEAEFMRL
uniref:Uncharacterized protein n=1 Tax=Oryza barthii TaxID=65489 RepID=A0A0D3HTV9_9ORYZ